MLTYIVKSEMSKTKYIGINRDQSIEQNSWQTLMYRKRSDLIRIMCKVDNIGDWVLQKKE